MNNSLLSLTISIVLKVNNDCLHTRQLVKWQFIVSFDSSHTHVNKKRYERYKIFQPTEIVFIGSSPSRIHGLRWSL